MWCSSYQKNITACCPVFCNLWFMQEYAEFQYRRRHRQRRRGDMHSLLSNTPDPDDPSESTLGMVLPGAAHSLATSEIFSSNHSVLLWMHFKQVSNILLYLPEYNIKTHCCTVLCDFRSVADFIVAAPLFKGKYIDLPTSNSLAIYSRLVFLKKL